MAGQLLLERLRKLNAKERINWVEVLPMVLDRYHDTPGESGFNPYQIVFGRERERSFGNLPYDSPTDCEDAQAFFSRMEIMDDQVAKILNAKHARRVQSINAGRHRSKRFEVGTQVWYVRPPKTGSKLDTRWLGPCRITSRIGENTYVIQVTPNRKMVAHATFLKPHVEDKFMGQPVSRYFHQRTRVDPKWVPQE
jgi:hypothetical protein